MFLPWIRLADAVAVGGVKFVPWKDEDGVITPDLVSADHALRTILGAYVELNGDPLENCVIATRAGRGALLNDADFETVREAAALLFFGAWASNEYYSPFAQHYVNAANFRLYAQRFSATPVWIGLSSRHRDGVRMNGGYRHDEVSFTVPAQCFPTPEARVDTALLAAFDAAKAANSSTMNDLLRAMPFVELANTDEDFMSGEAEAILMASAFEQFLHGDASAYKLARKFGVLFASCGSVTVATALAARPGIQIDTSTPQRAAAQPTWWVHRKWIEELYDLRSKSVHGGSTTHRTWGWTPPEHLVLAAVSFPLAVKFLLQRDGYYTLSREDRVRCRAFDQLAALPTWQPSPGHDSPWHEVMGDQRMNEIFDELARAAGLI